MNEQATCVGCGKPSTLLCDGRIYTLPDGEKVRVRAAFPNGNTKSCDAPICRACATKISDYRMRTSRGCRWNTIDYCPECHAARERTVPLSVQDKPWTGGVRDEQPQPYMFYIQIGRGNHDQH